MYGDTGGTPVAVAVVNELVEIVIEGKKYLMTKAAISIPRDLLKQFDCIVRGVIESIAKLQQYCSSKPGQYNKYRRQYALSTILTTALFR